MISTLGAANAIILASARLFSMARRNVFPQFLGVAHRGFTPGGFAGGAGLWSILLLFSGTFDTLTDTLIFVSWVFYAAGATGFLSSGAKSRKRRVLPGARLPFIRGSSFFSPSCSWR